MVAEFFISILGLGDTTTIFVPIVILMLMAVGLNYFRRRGRALAGGNRRAG